MSDRLALSLIIVSYNAADLLRRCLRSVFAHPPAVPFEVIVVDNASTEGNVDLVRREFPQVRLIVNEANLGFAAANNQGLRTCRGEFILLLNPDTEVPPGALTTLYQTMAAHSEVGVLGCQLLLPSGEPQNYDPHFPRPGPILLDFAHLRRLSVLLPSVYLPPTTVVGSKRHIINHKSESSGSVPAPSVPSAVKENEANNYRASSSLTDVDYVCGACFLVRRRALQQVGLLDEGYFLYGEETDWCWRMKQAGWRVAWTPAVKVWHHEGKSFRDALQRRAHYYASVVRFTAKHRGRGANLALRLGLAGLSLLKLGALVLLSRLGCLTPEETARRRDFFCHVLHIALRLEMQNWCNP